MLDLKDLSYFVNVVDRGGFSAAGRSLRIPKSTLSHRIQQLEASLGVRLVNRTSRRFGVTEIGRDFYQNAIATLLQAEHTEASIRQHLSEPSGVVRITTPVTIAQFALRDLLPGFLVRYPKVNIIQHATDVQIDIVAEGIDLALRGHSQPLPNSTLVQRKIARVPWLLFAGTDYLNQTGVPIEPADLAEHTAIAMGQGAKTAWRLQHQRGQEVVIEIEPRFTSNDIVALKHAACAGLGIVALPAYVCWPEVKTGLLRPLLPGWVAADSSITALIPYRRGLLPAVRVLIDYLAAEFPQAVAIDLE
ncbi:DNA-binding transcriptional LysR family regulator [Pararhizobium capsulatum DSM 1112]|uniref:DNA-binding transcriptional LysR family regulator n=1 Tax=Pararhizobium capsulatum DSM 1112 TaxID=1121113 RepID=A0ABU0BXE6_9HYPH|nr:LysR substrate-binding domain-containing protein [Pararhizobium capsulatum]MDQ0322930.1 DNA-binding transcriptional LysR family regulator [Pararhizobium capsulatum DSM 1112]